MKAIVNGKLYDTYKTRRGNVFAVVESENIFYDSEKVKELLNERAGDVDCYIAILER